MTFPPNTYAHKTPMILDVSAYENIPTNWDLVQPRPLAVICKASEGQSYHDPSFRRYYESLGLAGIARGAYHFYRFEYDTRKQAENFLSCLDAAGGFGELAPVLDCEWRDYKDPRTRKWVRSPKGERLGNQLRLFLDIIEAETGVIPMFYTSSGYVNEYMCNMFGRIMLPDYKRYPLWQAWYAYNPDNFIAPPPLKDWAWHIWQYSENGVLGGFPWDGVDMNVASALFDGGTGGTIPDPDPIPETFPKDAVVTSICMPYLNVRTGAGTNFSRVSPAKYYYPNNTLTVYETTYVGGNLWGRVGINEWVAMIYNGALWVRYL